MMILPLFFVTLLSCHLTEGYRILGLFPHPGRSHYAVFSPLMKGLADRGHEVVVVSYFPESTPYPNYTDLTLHIDEEVKEIYNIAEFYTPQSYSKYFMELVSLSEWGKRACQETLSSKAIDEVLDIHANNPFDLVITEYFNTDCMLGPIYKMNVKFIGLSSCVLMPWLPARIGTPDTPSYIASEFVGYAEKMNYWERFVSFTVSKSVKYLYRYFQQREDNALIEAKFGKGIPDVEEIALNTSFILGNQVFPLHGTRPRAINFIEIAGIHVTQALKPLPSDIKQILDNAKHGAIFMSWGSLVKASTMTDTMRKAFLTVFSELKQEVIWKYEEDMEVPKNVHIRKWVAQRDILCHPNVKVFLSHGGNLGSIEAVHCGVPVVGTPFYGDQPFNIASLEYRGIGVTLKVENISYENLKNSLQKMLDPEVKKKAETISRAFKDQPMSPLDSAIFWTEYAIKYDRELVVSEGRNLNWFVFYSIDILLPVIFGLFLVLFILKKVLGKILGCFLTSKENTELKKTKTNKKKKN